MCIIAIKKLGVNYPSQETMDEMCRRNPDGFALGWHIKGQKKSHIIRTLDVKKIMKKYQQLVKQYDKDDCTMFLHARIKTHGTIKVENCHGWYSHIAKTLFAHNGILSIENRNDLTDSETFYRDIFEPIFSVYGWRGAEKAINAIIGTSKFCFLDQDGNLRHYGNYIEESDGMLYSNTSYKPIYWHQYSNYAQSLRRDYYPSYYGKMAQQRHDDWAKSFDESWQENSAQDDCGEQDFLW